MACRWTSRKKGCNCDSHCLKLNLLYRTPPTFCVLNWFYEALKKKHSKRGLSFNCAVAGVDVPPECVDQPELANCELIVYARLCSNSYYSSFCCASCTRHSQKNDRFGRLGWRRRGFKNSGLGGRGDGGGQCFKHWGLHFEHWTSAIAKMTQNTHVRPGCAESQFKNALKKRDWLL